MTTPDGNANCANTVLQSQGISAWTPGTSLPSRCQTYSARSHLISPSPADPTTCINWLKYGGAPFDCEELRVPDRTQLDWSRYDGRFFKALAALSKQR